MDEGKLLFVVSFPFTRCPDEVPLNATATIVEARGICARTSAGDHIFETTVTHRQILSRGCCHKGSLSPSFPFSSLTHIALLGVFYAHI